MALILCIETSGHIASVALAHNGICISKQENSVRNEHSSFLQPAIRSIMNESGFLLTEIDAVAVSVGPGSYTGLRVGLASAKGICYALNKPLIEIGTLTIMATLAQQTLTDLQKKDSYYIIPMIDARRNEVFTATFDNHLNIIAEPYAIILGEDTFSELLSVPVYFTGDGALKWQTQCRHIHARFLTVQQSAADMSSIAEIKFMHQQFTPANTAVPLYGKAFFSSQQKKD